ncbi:MAG: hypothetical protein EZS28_009607 [Streblomastix strix]|uniref:Uncharacterized protein n=1 Tax=Streblomastix strix TaxID=222440 RepID=A0A5J4WJE4_9EUKA|nr:MAG: hypothetical protein EZS28_009607 [Streblomastix strix]
MQQLSRKDSHFSHFKTRNDGHFVAACGQISLQQYGVVIWEKQAGGKFVEIDCFEVSPTPILIDWAHSTFGEIICTASESGIVNLFIRTSRTSKDKQHFCLIRQFSAPFSLNISSLSFGPHTFGFFVGCISQAKQFEDGLLPEEYIPVKGHFSVFFRNPSADKSSFSDTSPLSIDEELLLPRSISINEQSWNTLHLPLRYYPLSFCWEKALPPSIYTLSEKSQSSLTSYTTSAPQAAIGCKGGDVLIHSAKFSPFANAVAVRFLDKTFSIWEVDPQNMQTAEHEEEGENMQKDESAEKAGVLFKFQEEKHKKENRIDFQSCEMLKGEAIEKQMLYLEDQLSIMSQVIYAHLNGLVDSVGYGEQKVFCGVILGCLLYVLELDSIIDGVDEDGEVRLVIVLLKKGNIGTNGYYPNNNKGGGGRRLEVTSQKDERVYYEFVQVLYPILRDGFAVPINELLCNSASEARDYESSTGVDQIGEKEEGIYCDEGDGDLYLIRPLQQEQISFNDENEIDYNQPRQMLILILFIRPMANQRIRMELVQYFVVEQVAVIEVVGFFLEMKIYQKKKKKKKKMLMMD